MSFKKIFKWFTCSLPLILVLILITKYPDYSTSCNPLIESLVEFLEGDCLSWFKPFYDKFILTFIPNSNTQISRMICFSLAWMVQFRVFWFLTELISHYLHRLLNIREDL